MTDGRGVKICGIKTVEALHAAVQSGARYVGLVFYPPSPRSLSPLQASELALHIPTATRAVGLFVDPDDDLLEQVVSQVPLDMIQLHGEESSRRVAEIRSRYGLPVIKSIGVADKKDLELLNRYMDVADMMLLDAKPPKNVEAILPGGNGLAFDWTLLADVEIHVPWMLGGGLNPHNVTEAIEITGAPNVDVSSGVESRPGAKDEALIREFLHQVQRTE